MTQPTKAVVLSSGGVDSTTCLALATERFGCENVLACSVFYGQRHSKELECAQAIANHYGVRHHVLNLANVLEQSDNALMADSPQDIPHGTYALQKQRDEFGMVNTYVPFRNGLMLSSVAALALSVFPKERVVLFLGAHADDAAEDAYPDCTPQFVKAMGEAITLGTYGLVELETPFVNSRKAEVVAKGLELGVPYELTWSCYEGADTACGACATCLDRLAAFAANGATDPIPYASR